MLMSRCRSIYYVSAGLVIFLCIRSNFANPEANPSRASFPLSRREIVQSRCQQPHLKNGRSIMKQRRKMVKFDCSKGYKLMGSIYAACSNGKWDAMVPVCAKRGCPELETPADGFLIDEDKGLMMTLFCKGTHQVAGNRKVYCDGTMWDRELGTCRETSKKPQTWCDFETEDLCRWLHDDPDYFEWKRQSSIQANIVHTGPKWDYTHKDPSKGHYMLLESTAAFEGERARLISPLYEAEESINACFSMHYFLYGAGAGTLRVFAKPFSTSMETILNDDRYLFFNVSGNQRNRWHNVTVDIDQFNEPFQIVIEGISKNGFYTAIDDVAIFQGTRCAKEESEMNQKSNETEEGGVIFDYQSCKLRCNETKPEDDVKQNQSVDIVASCDCHPECEDIKTCCPDYRSICAFGSDNTQLDVIVSDADNNGFVGTTEVVRLQSTEDVLPNSKIEAPTLTTTLASKTIMFDVTKISSSKPKILVQPSSKDHQNKSTTPTYTTVKLNVKKLAAPITVVPYSKSTAEINNNEMQSTSFYEASTFEKEIYLDKSTVAMMQDDPDTAHLVNIGTMDSSLSENEASDPAPHLILVVVLSLFSISVLLVGAVFGLKYYYKNYTPESYKKNAELANRRSCREQDKFSDVIYLTEEIDFTLQAPSNS